MLTVQTPSIRHFITFLHKADWFKQALNYRWLLKKPTSSRRTKSFTTTNAVTTRPEMLWHCYFVGFAIFHWRTCGTPRPHPQNWWASDHGCRQTPDLRATKFWKTHRKLFMSADSLKNAYRSHILISNRQHTACHVLSSICAAESLQALSLSAWSNLFRSICPKAAPTYICSSRRRGGIVWILNCGPAIVLHYFSQA